MPYLTAIEVTAIITTEIDPQTNPTVLAAIAAAQLKAQDEMFMALQSPPTTHINFAFEIRYGKEND